MASRFVNNDAQRALKRINGEISIGSEDKKDFLNIAKAHFAAGNSGDAVTMITALGRFDERNEIDNRLAALEQRQTQSTKPNDEPVRAGEFADWAHVIKDLVQEVKDLKATIAK